MKRTLIIVVVLLASGLAFSDVGAQDANQETQRETSQVTFYGHVFGHGLDAPMPANTEAPVGEDNYGFGTFEWCTSAGTYTLGGVPSSDDCASAANNKVALFSTAGFVQVESVADFSNNGGYSLLHNERGQTKDIVLDTSESITADIYLTIDYHSWPARNAHGTNCAVPHPPNVPCLYPYWGWDAGAQPNFIVTAELYQAQLGDRTNASAAPPIHQTLDSGEAELIASGQWGPDTAMTGLPGSPNAQQFTIDLGPPQVDKVTRDNDFFLVYSFQSTSPAGDVGIHSARIWAGEFFPPTFTLPVKNAFDVERVIPNFAHGKLAILGVINTPWGSYDVDDDSVELEIRGPDGRVSPSSIDRFGDFSVAHGGHFLPVNLTWIWDYNQENLDPGAYTVTISGSNFQGSASASCSATFELVGTKDKGLQPGAVEEGVCGLQSASDEFLEGIQEGASNDAGGR